MLCLFSLFLGSGSKPSGNSKISYVKLNRFGFKLKYPGLTLNFPMSSDTPGSPQYSRGRRRGASIHSSGLQT